MVSNVLYRIVSNYTPCKKRFCRLFGHFFKNNSFFIQYIKTLNEGLSHKITSLVSNGKNYIIKVYVYEYICICVCVCKIFYPLCISARRKPLQSPRWFQKQKAFSPFPETEKTFVHVKPAVLDLGAITPKTIK